MKLRTQGYKQSTSETNLKSHLVKVHNFTSFANDETPIKQRTIIVNNCEKITVSQDTAEIARVLSETKGLKTREYFIQVPNESSLLIFCVYCLVQGFRQRYSITTSPTNLLRHLRLKHCVDPKQAETEFYEENYEEVTNEVMSDDVEEIIEESEDEPITYEPQPVHKVLLPTCVTPQKQNVKYCRSCGSHNISFFSRFSSLIRLDNDEPGSLPMLTLGDIYTDITGVQIYPDDGMSQAICYPCEANLKTAYHFKTQANKTEEKMVQRFSIDQPMEIPSTSIKHEIEEDSEEENLNNYQRARRRKAPKRINYVEDCFMEET